MPNIPAKFQGSDEADALSRYLSEIGKYELLTADKEVELAQAVEAGRDAAAVLEEKRGRIGMKERILL